MKSQNTSSMMVTKAGRSASLYRPQTASAAVSARISSATPREDLNKSFISNTPNAKQKYSMIENTSSFPSNQTSPVKVREMCLSEIQALRSESKQADYKTLVQSRDIRLRYFSRQKVDRSLIHTPRVETLNNTFCSAVLDSPNHLSKSVIQSARKLKQPGAATTQIKRSSKLQVHNATTNRTSLSTSQNQQHLKQILNADQQSSTKHQIGHSQQFLQQSQSQQQQQQQQRGSRIQRNSRSNSITSAQNIKGILEQQNLHLILNQSQIQQSKPQQQYLIHQLMDDDNNDEYNNNSSQGSSPRSQFEYTVDHIIQSHAQPSQLANGASPVRETSLHDQIYLFDDYFSQADEVLKYVLKRQDTENAQQKAILAKWVGCLGRRDRMEIEKDKTSFPLPNRLLAHQIDEGLNEVYGSGANRVLRPGEEASVIETFSRFLVDCKEFTTFSELASHNVPGIITKILSESRMEYLLEGFPIILKQIESHWKIMATRFRCSDTMPRSHKQFEKTLARASNRGHFLPLEKKKDNPLVAYLLRHSCSMVEHRRNKLKAERGKRNSNQLYSAKSMDRKMLPSNQAINLSSVSTTAAAGTTSAATKQSAAYPASDDDDSPSETAQQASQKLRPYPARLAYFSSILHELR